MNPIELFNLKGKVALVTGASRGLGRGFAKCLASAGADVILTSRNAADLDAVRRELEPTGCNSLGLSLDVTKEESIRKAFTVLREHHDKLDILVNNAGCNVRKPALDVSWEDWNVVLNTNLRGSFFVAQEAARMMIARNYGRIINIGSVTSVAGYAGLGPYGASRGGIRQLTMSHAAEWGPHGITVNCLAPGWFKTAQNAVLYENADWVEYLTDRIPLRRPGREGDLDGALLFLASDASAYVSGQLVLVDGGISVNDTRALPPNSGDG